MSAKLLFFALASLRFLLIGILCSSSAVGETLREMGKFDLPGPGGKRFDYLTIDADDQYLISAHLAADQTYVIDHKGGILKEERTTQHASSSRKQAASTR